MHAKLPERPVQQARSAPWPGHVLGHHYDSPHAGQRAAEDAGRRNCQGIQG